VNDPIEHPEPADDAAREPGDEGDDGDGPPSPEQLARRTTRIRARAAADVTAMLSYAVGLRHAVELAEQNRDGPDGSPGC
jgi:hypothetical protein